MQNLAIDSAVVCAKRAEHANEEVCAMCGEFCAVKILREVHDPPAEAGGFE
jgi:phosphomethylpyrimidine synthase